MQMVGQRLRELREGVKLSQNKIAGIVGVRQSSVNRYENGQSDPPYPVLLRYADYFDVSLDYIFGRTDKPQGKLYQYKPKFKQDTPEMRRFVEMCFDPKSPMYDRLKQTLLDMLGDEKK